MFKFGQIVKIKGQTSKNLYRYGDKEKNTDFKKDTISIYNINSLDNKFKTVGHTCDYNDFLKPTLSDILDFVNYINRDDEGNFYSQAFINLARFGETVPKHEIALVVSRSQRNTVKSYLQGKVFVIKDTDNCNSDQVVFIIRKFIFERDPSVDLIDFSRFDNNNIIVINYEDIDTTEFVKKNTIRFINKNSAIDSRLADKNFEISDIRMNQSLFDRRSCEIEITSDVPIYQVFGSLRPEYNGIVTLSDGTIYEVSHITQINQMCEPCGYFGNKFKISLTFGHWEVSNGYHYSVYYEPRPINFVNISDVKPINLEVEIKQKVIDELIRKTDEEMCKRLGIDFGIEKDKTATAIVEAEKFNSLKHAYMKYCKDDLYTVNNVEIKKEKESDNMKINDKELKQIIINKGNGTVTAITEEDPFGIYKLFGVDKEPTKKATVAKLANGDEFDKYVGVALALAYQLFGSKSAFRKFVNESESVKDLEKIAKAKEETRKAKEAELEKAKAKKAKKEAQKSDKDPAVALLEQLKALLEKTTKKTKKGE